MSYFPRVEMSGFGHALADVGASTHEQRGARPAAGAGSRFGAAPAVGALATLFTGTLTDASLGALSPIGPLKNDGSAAVRGDVNMDAEIAPDGEWLLFTEAFFSGSAIPDRADLGVAERQPDGSFVVWSRSTDWMQNVNSSDLEYAPSSSTDQTELYFTRWLRSGPQAGTFMVLVSRRASSATAWGLPNRVAAIVGDFTEAPSLSGDGRSLYYHRRVGNRYRIYRVTRGR